MSSRTHSPGNQPHLGPYDSMRDYIYALETEGRLVRIPEIDQDFYEATALAYRMIDRLGKDRAPALLIERLKIDGEWREGPVICNPYGSFVDEAMTFGLDTETEDEQELYKIVIEAIGKRRDAASKWLTEDPVEIDASMAPCKEVIHTGDDIDILQYAFLKNNPADAGRYLNMGSVFLYDEEIGPNVGTYRCQLKDKNKIAVNPQPGQHGWLILNAKKRRGEKVAPCAIAFGSDPITFAVSSNRMAGLGESELAIAGGLRGKPVEVVKCETVDYLVPATAEMIIEGEIPLDESEPEGPYAEMYGYMGPEESRVFFMNITAITHRHQPWVMNSFTGVTNDMPMSPQLAAEYFRYKAMLPNLTGYYLMPGAFGFAVVSIDKRAPGEGIQTGQTIAATPFGSKTVIVVDKDINILDPHSILHAIGARWQPSAHLFIPQTLQRAPDPSLPHRGLSSKMVIDATRQLPDEGGPAGWPPYSRTLLEENAPESFERIDGKWSEFFGGR